MSDPSSGHEVYQCHGPMRQVTLLKVHPDPLFFLCDECGIWRDCAPRGDTRRQLAKLFAPAYASLMMQFTNEVRSRGTDS